MPNVHYTTSAKNIQSKNACGKQSSQTISVRRNFSAECPHTLKSTICCTSHNYWRRLSLYYFIISPEFVLQKQLSSSFMLHSHFFLCSTAMWIMLTQDTRYLIFGIEAPPMLFQRPFQCSKEHFSKYGAGFLYLCLILSSHISLFSFFLSPFFFFLLDI